MARRKTEQFAHNVTTNAWNDWFSCSTTGNKPWYYYATPLFRKTSLQLCERSLAAFDTIILGDSTQLDYLLRRAQAE